MGAPTRRWVVLGRKYHCVVRGEVAVVLNGMFAFIYVVEQRCGRYIGKEIVKRGKQVAVILGVVIHLRNALRRGDRLAEVKLDNIKFGLYISFFHGCSPYLPVMEAIAGSLATPFAS